MAILIVVELLTLCFAIYTMLSVTAFVGTEGLWSKAKKKTVYHLRKYNRTQAEADYVAFLGFMEEQLEELHGGYMYIDGDINTGSRFYFTIAKNIT